MNRLLFASLILILSAFLLGAWIFFKNSEKPNRKIFLKSGDFFFSEKVLRVKENQTIDFEVENDGNHTFVIDELGVRAIFTQGKNNFQIKPIKKGAFIFYCDIPGHRKAGQWGKLIVE